MRMGLREANQRFTKAMKTVREGRELVLTERGKPIAVIKPWRRGASESSVQRLEAAGLLRAAAKPVPMPAWTPRTLKGEPMSQTLREERDAS